MPKLNLPGALFSLNSFAAAMLALYIALALGLPRPFWALTTAYIVSSPQSGAVRSKAVYRIAGTIVGAIVTVALVPNLVNSPPVLCLALALWVGACLAVSLLDRTPRSYFTMLSGYTAALIGFPSVTQPGLVFDVAVARVEEIGLGILCASLVHSLIFPRPVGGALRDRLAEWLGDADRWALDVLGGCDAPAVVRDRTRLAAAASEIHMLATHLPFDTSRLRDTRAAVRALHDRMLLLIPLLSGVGDRLQAIAGEGGLRPEERALADATAGWVEAGAPLAAGEALAARLRAFREAQAVADWRGLLVESLMLRLEEAVEALGEAHALLAHLHDQDAPESAEVARALGAARRRPMHRDLALALRSGVTAVVAILICCGLWIGLGWHEGVMAAMMTAVFCSFFATLDDPAPQIANFGLYAFLSLPMAALYLFAVMPAISGFPLLAAVLLPTLFVLGLYMAEPSTSGKALPFLMTFASALALQETFTADLPSFLNGNLAQFVGVFVSILVTRVLRSMGAEAGARRLLVRTWRSLAGLARTGVAPEEPGQFTAQLVDRLALLSPKLGGGGERQDDVGEAALADLRVAMNLMAIQRARPEIDGEAGQGLDQVRQALGAHFAGLARTGRRPPEPGVLRTLDEALVPMNRLGGQAARTAAASLVGLRRNLFPDAPPFAEARA